MYIERPHSLAKPEGIVQQFQIENRDFQQPKKLITPPASSRTAAREPYPRTAAFVRRLAAIKQQVRHHGAGVYNTSTICTYPVHTVFDILNLVLSF